MTNAHPDPDPFSEFEQEGIPDLEEAYPERVWSQDPQRAPIPRDRAPLNAEDYETGPEGQRQSESLDDRLKREQPDATLAGRESYDIEADAMQREFDPVMENEPSRRAGRLVEPEAGAQTDTTKDVIAREVGPDRGGFLPEEQAMRVEEEGP